MTIYKSFLLKSRVCTYYSRAFDPKSNAERQTDPRMVPPKEKGGPWAPKKKHIFIFYFMKSDVGSLALLDINFSHGEESVFEMHLRLGPWMVYFLLFLGSLGLRDLPLFEDHLAILARVRCLLFLWCIWNCGAFFVDFILFFSLWCLVCTGKEEMNQHKDEEIRDRRIVNPNCREDLMPNAERPRLLEERNKKVEEEIRKEQAAKGC